MGKNKVVVIEDDVDLAAALKDSLEGRGFAVTVANTGEAGVELIRTETPDVVLLDSVLPGMSGIEVLENTVSDREQKNIPVIMLSNLDNPEDIKKAREFEIEEYLVKTDWRLDDVVTKIKKAIG